MHWFNYVWIVPIAIGVLVWAYFSICDIIASIRDYIDEKEAGLEEGGLLSYMADYLEDYTRNFIAIILFVLFFSSFICFIVNCVHLE